jgi:hypothetical protein
MRKEFQSAGKTLLSNIIKMSSIEIKDGTAFLKIPEGQMNDDFESEKYRIKQILHKHFPNSFENLEVTESIIVQENSDPYTFDDKISDLNERCPDFGIWIEKLGLKQ